MYIINIALTLLLMQAEELIKQEMLTMLHHDAVYSPSPAQMALKDSQKTTNQAQHLAYLDRNPYQEFEEEDIKQVAMGEIRIS